VEEQVHRAETANPVHDLDAAQGVVLQEEDAGELLQIVLVRQAVVAEDVAVRPELLDIRLGCRSWG
jgi:hypothetical protein